MNEDSAFLLWLVGGQLLTGVIVFPLAMRYVYRSRARRANRRRYILAVRYQPEYRLPWRWETRLRDEKGDGSMLVRSGTAKRKLLATYAARSAARRNARNRRRLARPWRREIRR